MALSGTKMKGADILIEAAFTPPVEQPSLNLTGASITFMAYSAAGQLLCNFSTANGKLEKTVNLANRQEITGKILGRDTEKMPGIVTVNWYFKMQVGDVVYLPAAYTGSFLLDDPSV